MTSHQSKAKQKYDREYNARPDQVKKREMRNQARAEMMKAGKVHKGDGKDVDHRAMLDGNGTNAKSNLRVVSQTENRGWRKDHGKQYGK
jgi:ferredoxin-fold anticodon binding domain-containing protein